MGKAIVKGRLCVWETAPDYSPSNGTKWVMLDSQKLLNADSNVIVPWPKEPHLKEVDRYDRLQWEEVIEG
jgi:hypothetical protein